LLVAPGDVEGLSEAIRRFFGDGELRDRLRAASIASVADYAPERVFARLEETLSLVARTDG
jgi:glycosyltransferase involved in cell wall biosynthesis